VGQGHKLASLAIPQYGLSLVTTQDANGNHIGGSDGTQAGSKTYTYTAQNQANAIYQGSASSPSLRTRFWYGPDGSRYKRQDDGSAQTGSTTTYLGGVERIATGSAIKWRRPIGGVVLQEITGETTSSGITVAGSGGTSYQLYTDHLGSVALWVTLSGSTPTVVNRFDYAPHGEPRPTGLVRTLGPATTIVPWRGFTGHEHIDALSTIHMNGRIYDPLLGRFLQPDPIVQQAYTPQNWNPYSYVLNNPLSFTDPSGYSFVKKYWRQIVAIVVSYVTYGAASNWAAGWAASATTQGAFAGAVSGFAGGAISSGSLKGGLQGAFSGAVFGGIGGHYGNRVTAGRVAASGAAGGVLAELQGGKFGHGFVSAGLATAAAPYVPQDTAGGTVVSALIGGTVSAMTGGKFANGAVTAAFSYAIGRMAGSYLDRQQGANADKNSRDVEVLTKQVRRSFSAARQLAMSALDDYCSAQGGCAPGGSSVDFSAVDFKFDRKLFFGDESSASVGLTGGYVDRRSYSPPSVVLYAGGIAFQGNGTGPSAVAEVLLHEFMHVTPAGTAISQSYWQSGQSLPYLQRPHEIDAFNFAKEVMKYAH
jgi:RHS repeat-associated protein